MPTFSPCHRLIEHIRKHGGFVDMKRVHLHALPCLPEALCVTDDDVAACRRLAGLTQAALSKAICRLQRSNTLCMNVPDLSQILERVVPVSIAGHDMCLLLVRCTCIHSSLAWQCLHAQCCSCTSTCKVLCMALLTL